MSALTQKFFKHTGPFIFLTFVCTRSILFLSTLLIIVLGGRVDGGSCGPDGCPAQAEADLKAQKELLQAALDELEKLKPVCVDSGMSQP